ncbi:hypothetical protein K0M31_016952 [Melipona bicolor]|uniref:Uncharacterized protein n=1 Tax=Melipona bicolor TaxID=60889 RepID=A0AA40FDR5_9HYME|nr:hypothetical protein K0M31_016952 [Melipona bicolor]
MWLAKLPFREQRSCKEKLQRRADKKEAQLVSSPPPFREETVLPARPPIPLRSVTPGPSLACDLFFGEVKLSFISSGCNEAASSLVGAAKPATGTTVAMMTRVPP